jgi:peptidoglycan/LPS O-acetylase OafA/YrhL
MTAVEPARVGAPEVERLPTVTWLPSLAGLRFVAVVIVFGFHIDVSGVIPEGELGDAVRWVFAPGAAGVSFFFVLSGFVLTWSARNGDTAVRFWRRRFARIYPTYLVVLLAALAAAALADHAMRADVVVPNLLLIQGWVPDPQVYFGPNPVAWYLTCEVAFYAAFPLLYAGLLRLPGRALWPAVACVFAVTWAIPLLALQVTDPARYWVVWIVPAARLPEFVAGMLLARIVRERGWPDASPWLFVGFAAAAYFCSSWLPIEFRLVAGTAVPLALLVAALGAADAARRPTPWRAPWLVRLGELAFGFYLVHDLAIRLMVKLSGSGPAGSATMAVAVTLAAFALALISSALLYRFVEIPGARLLRPSRRQLTE